MSVKQCLSRGFIPYSKVLIAVNPSPSLIFSSYGTLERFTSFLAHHCPNLKALRLPFFNAALFVPPPDTVFHLHEFAFSLLLDTSSDQYTTALTLFEAQLEIRRLHWSGTAPLPMFRAQSAEVGIICGQPFGMLTLPFRQAHSFVEITRE